MQASDATSRYVCFLALCRIVENNRVEVRSRFHPRRPKAPFGTTVGARGAPSSRGDDRNPFSVYDFTPRRRRDGPERFLSGFRGYLQADAFTGYDRICAGPG
jgi:hypothetical protein